MVKGILFGFMIVVLLVGQLTAAAQGQEGLQPGLAMALGQAVGIFAEADVKSEQLATLEPGELVNVVEVEKTWARVEYGDVTGWVRYSFMNVIFLVNVPGPTPVSRGYHQMTYDVESDRVILFGGQALTPNLNDTWSYEVATNTWVRMTPAQSPPPGEGPLAYDIQSDRAILFLGAIFSTGEIPGGEPSETWAYDFDTDTWTNVEPSTAPPPLLGARMVYDGESDRMILFGGLDAIAFATGGGIVYTNKTWAYDFDSNTWTQMAPEVSPPGVNYQPMAYDAGADRVILIGSNASEITDDTWVYDYNTDTWEARQTAESPKHRDYSAMVYAAGTGQTILFGGPAKNDT